MPSCNAICNFNWRVAHSHTAYDKKNCIGARV